MFASAYGRKIGQHCNAITSKFMNSYKKISMLASQDPSAAPGPASPSEQALSEAGLKIIVVEDNADFRDLLCEMLLMLGHDVSSVVSAEEALENLAAQPADILISDVSLPGISGVELAKKVHATLPQMKIILSSGYGDTIASQLRFEVTVLSKPYTLTQLAEALDPAAA